MLCRPVTDHCQIVGSNSGIRAVVQASGWLVIRLLAGVQNDGKPACAIGWFLVFPVIVGTQAPAQP